MTHLTIPVIGIGAGAATDGQVLVFTDLLGIYDGHVARFVERFADVRSHMVAGPAEYAAEVRRGAFPAPEHRYSIDDAELVSFPGGTDLGPAFPAPACCGKRRSGAEGRGCGAGHH